MGGAQLRPFAYFFFLRITSVSVVPGLVLAFPRGTNCPVPESLTLVFGFELAIANPPLLGMLNIEAGSACMEWLTRLLGGGEGI